MPGNRINRRELFKFSAAGIYTLSSPVAAFASTHIESPLRFGVIADVHKDVMHDADDRLRAFIEEMTTQKVDYIIQLGDFCIPTLQNQDFLKRWNSFAGPRYHVLGNHDTDGNKTDHPHRFKREETVAYWGMASRYYSFEIKGIHVVVLDGNDQGPGQQPYYRWIADEQLTWFERDLDSTNLPTIVFVHQSPERPEGIGLENGAQVRGVMEEANRKAGSKQVIACFTGHHHRDYVRHIGGILYSQINSASYHWLGKDHPKIRYSPEIDKSHPIIKYTVPYKDSLFAVVTIDTVRGFLAIEGRESEFVGPSPWEMGASRERLDAATLVPRISDRRTPV